MKLYQQRLELAVIVGTLSVLILSFGKASAQPILSAPSQPLVAPSSQKFIYAEPTDFSCDLTERVDGSGNVLKKNVPATVALVDLAPVIQAYRLSTQYVPTPQDAQTERSRQRRVPLTATQPSEKSLKRKVVVYYWLENDPEEGETALMRCRRVAAVLSEIKRQNSFHLISVGYMNGRRVLCIASKQGGPCSQLIFPLRAHEQSDECSEAVLKDFLEALKGLALKIESEGNLDEDKIIVPLLQIDFSSEPMVYSQTSDLARRRFSPPPLNISPSRITSGGVR